MLKALILTTFFTLSAYAESFDRNTLVFLGSSSFDNWKSMAKDFAPLKILNLGKGGTTYSYLLEHAEEWASSYPARRFVIYSGDNDIATLQPPARIAANFQQLARILKQKVPDAQIYVLSIKPNRTLSRRLLVNRTKQANRLIEQFAGRNPYITYVDIFHPMLDESGQPRRELFIDGLHPSPLGYRLWRDTLRAKLH